MNSIAETRRDRRPRLVLAGGRGFLGGALTEHFAARGWEIVVLTRHPRKSDATVRDVSWDGESVSEWTQELEHSRALVNLCGVSVDCRYHARNRRRIMDSRVRSTRTLGDAIARCSAPPEVWLNSSTATIYRHTFGPAWGESGEVGGTPGVKDEFSVEVATAWEHVLNTIATDRTRKLLLRTAMVLGLGRNSVFPSLRRLVRLGLGGSMSGGRQFVSWIHERDFCHAVEWLIDHPEMEGPINLAAPVPVTNEEMMRTFREICGRRFGLPASREMLEIGAFLLRTETELIIKSRRVVPAALLRSGFRFSFREMRAALEDLENRISLTHKKSRKTAIQR